MHRIYEERVLFYSIDLLFNIITDVESYSDFLPGCKAARILEDFEDRKIVECKMQYLTFSENYMSEVLVLSDTSAHTVIIKAIDGPFKFLESTWYLQKIQDTRTKIIFKMNFEFKSKILDNLIFVRLSYIKNKVIEAFERRAIKKSTMINK